MQWGCRHCGAEFEREDDLDCHLEVCQARKEARMGKKKKGGKGC